MALGGFTIPGTDLQKLKKRQAEDPQVEAARRAAATARETGAGYQVDPTGGTTYIGATPSGIPPAGGTSYGGTSAAGGVPTAADTWEQEQKRLRLQAELAERAAGAERTFTGEQATQAQTFQGQQASLARQAAAAEEGLRRAFESEQAGVGRTFAGEQAGLGRQQELDVLRTGAGLQESAEQRRIAAIPEVLRNIFGGLDGGGGIGRAQEFGLGTTVIDPSTGQAVHGQPAAQNPEEAARAAAFARAKDITGRTSRAALNSLQNIMAGSGRAGSPIEAGLAADIVGEGQGQLGEFTREQLMQDLNRAAQISDRDVAAGLTRRGQNIGAIQSILGGLFGARGLY